MPQTLSVDIIDTLDGAEAIRADWSDLLHSSGSRNPFAGPEWPLSWWRHVARTRDQLMLMVVRDADQLAGVFPLYKQHQPMGIRVLQSVGKGPIWVGPYEAPSGLCGQAYVDKAARALVQFLCDRSHDWDWARLRPGETAAWLDVGWPTNGATLTEADTQTSVVLALPRRDADPFRSSRNLKESLRRARNRLTKEFGAEGWSVNRLASRDELASAFDRLVALHQARVAADRGPAHFSAFTDDRARLCIRDAVVSAADHGRASIYELVAGGAVMASQMVLHTSTASYISMSGATEEAWPFSAVTLLQGHAVNDAEDRGECEMNLSVTPLESKLRWSRTTRTEHEFLLLGARRSSRIRYAATHLGSRG